MIRERGAAQTGFTLVEILVVVIIIGILAAIATVTFLNQRRVAFDAQALSDLRNLIPVQIGLEAETGAFSQDPADFDRWQASGDSVVCVETLGDDAEGVSVAAWSPQGSQVFTWTSTTRLFGTVAVPLPATCQEQLTAAATQVAP